MTKPGPATPDEFFVGHPEALAAYVKVRALVDRFGFCDVRTSKSQVALRRRHGFAYLWMPGRYLAKPAAEVVLTIALDHELDSPRFKQVAHPSPTHWMHHLEIHDLEEIDDEVEEWLREAFDLAG